MSLVSFRVYKEMARQHGSAAAFRGKPEGRFKNEKGDVINVADQSRMPINIDQETLNFLEQFEQKDWHKALDARNDLFIEIIKKLNLLVTNEIKKSGIEQAVFNYIKTGDAGNLDSNIVDFIDKRFTNNERKSIRSDLRAPDNVKILIERIKKFLMGFEVVGNNYIVGEERKNSILGTLEKADKAEGIEKQNLTGELKKIFIDLQLDNNVEDMTESFLYEIFREKTVDNKKFWDDNGLNPTKVTFDLSDGRTVRHDSSKRSTQEANPYFFRLYHKLERTKGELHLDDLKEILGSVGQYGYDFKYPKDVPNKKIEELQDKIKEEKDEKKRAKLEMELSKEMNRTPEVEALGASLGKENHAEDVRDYFQMHSHGHYGNHFLSDSDEAIWMPVKVAGKIVPDPTYKWIFDSLFMDIKDSWTETNDRGKKKPIEDPIEDDDEDYGDCYSPGGKFLKDDCARIKAKKILVKAVEQGKLHAPPVPCTSKMKDCPGKEDRKYKVCPNCSGTGKPIFGKGTKKKNECISCGGTGVIVPPVYIPHMIDGKGKLSPLLNPSNYKRQVHHDASGKPKDWYLSQVPLDKDAHDEAISVAKELMGDHYVDGIEYTDNQGNKRSVGFPVWVDHEVGTDDLNFGNPAFTKTVGPNLNKMKKTQEFIDPLSPLGSRILNTVLVKKEFKIKGLGKTFHDVVPGFMSGILECLGRGTCGGAPNFIIKVLKDNLFDIHNAVFQAALNSLGQFRNVNPDDEKDTTLSRFAATKTASIAQRVSTSEGEYTRRLGNISRQLSGSADDDHGTYDFADSGYDSSSSEKLRGAPARGKEKRISSIRDSIENLNLTPEQRNKLFQFTRQSSEDSTHAIQPIPSSIDDDPINTLRKKVSLAKEKNDQFFVHLKQLLISLGRPTEDIDNFISNSRDSSMEDILISLGQVAPTAKPKSLPTFVPKPKAQGSGLAGRVRSLKSNKPPNSTEEPDGERDPKVDWFKFELLPISERITYLKSKLKN